MDLDDYLKDKIIMEKKDNPEMLLGSLEICREIITRATQAIINKDARSLKFEINNLYDIADNLQDYLGY